MSHTSVRATIELLSSSLELLTTPQLSMSGPWAALLLNFLLVSLFSQESLALISSLKLSRYSAHQLRTKSIA